MSIKVIPLGINGYIPTYQRHTSSILILNKPTAILLDAGSGVARLFEKEISAYLADCNEFHVVLSHYHLDHVMGIFFLPEIWSTDTIHIYAPTSPFIEVNPREAISRMLAPPLTSDFGTAGDTGLTFHGISNQQFEINDLTIKVKPQKHLGGSIGIRINDLLVYATDTTADDKTAEFAQGCRYLLHDTYLTDEYAQQYPISKEAHTTIDDAIRLAKMSQAEYFVPFHLYPGWDGTFLQGLQNKISLSGVKSIIPVEGKILEAA